ncbi:unnamed protein product [Gongylonema pulchrum]|uniref:NOGCT domain-containing protein n=1 Tax=Gongylonema pulchrum TaxID=637853 RepID=A0A183CVA8_9BILA|nr:unnamed protein product [Gongylonema pulchrum]
MVKDPDAAKEKLEEIDRQRILRAAEQAGQEELKTQSTNPELKARLQEMRKIDREILKSSAEEAGKALKNKESSVEAEVAQTSLRSGEVQKHQRSHQNPEAFSSRNVENSINVEWGEKSALWETEQAKSEQQEPQDLVRREVDQSMHNQKTSRDKKSMDVKRANIDQLFDKAEQQLIETTLEESKRLKAGERKLRDPDRSVSTPSSVKDPKKNENKKTAAVEKVPVDISMDPQHFLQAETSAMLQVSADLVENFDDIAEEADSQQTIIAEAFEDDDVIGDFEAEKEAVEAVEAPKDIDLTLHGWGSWTGPGISNKKKDKFVIKAKKKQRKDAGKMGLIISEKPDASIEKIQLRSVPFPYTTVEDYEAVVRQPLGKEWNPQRIHKKLIQPHIVTKVCIFFISITTCAVEMRRANLECVGCGKTFSFILSDDQFWIDGLLKHLPIKSQQHQGTAHQKSGDFDDVKRNMD